MKDAPPTDWAIKPWTAYGAITELVGEAKAAGKSTFVQHMISAYLDSTPFLGESTSGGPVAYLTEEGSTTLKEALSLANLLRPELHLLQWAKVWSKPWGELMRQVRVEIKELGARLLIVDTLPQFAPECEGDTESGLESLQPLRRIASDGVAVLVIRHERKAGGRVGKSGRGTTAIPGGVDIMLQLRRRSSKEKNTRTLDSLSRFRATPEQTIIELGPDGYVHADKIAVDLVAARKAILSSLNGAWRSLESIADEVNLSRSTVSRTVKVMMDAGELLKKGVGTKNSPMTYKKVSTENEKEISNQRKLVDTKSDKD